MGEHGTGPFADVAPEQVSAVRSADDLVAVVRRMHEDLHDKGEQEWENGTLDRFLEALAAVTEDRAFDGREPSWADVADLLVGATGYE
jgi:hypothetical protein